MKGEGRRLLLLLSRWAPVQLQLIGCSLAAPSAAPAQVIAEEGNMPNIILAVRPCH